ncbi:MAG TPA: SDR family oxidoreductase [Synergistaceae bacterium]|nr:SDR family oxidoreductase [Synergistaceae bacterium]HPQ36526.1 SDR family oxidoreductase [Synergistaceae bacterium]
MAFGKRENSAERPVVLVTGSSRGIGAALVRHFALRECPVVLNYRSSLEEARGVCEKVRQEYPQARILPVQGDVGTESGVRGLFDAAEERFGGVDVLINNAGRNLDGAFTEMSEEQWDAVHHAVLKSVFLCSREYARRYEGSRGCILSVASGTAFHGRKNGANYCSAKAGVVNLTKDMALELAPRIRVNCVGLGIINTDEVMTRYRLREEEPLREMLRAIPLDRLGTPEDVADCMDFLVFRGSYMTGQTIFVNGGWYMH